MRKFVADQYTRQDFGNGSRFVKRFWAQVQIPLKGDSCEVGSTAILRLLDEALGEHASVRGQARAANMMLVRCSSGYPSHGRAQ